MAKRVQGQPKVRVRVLSDSLIAIGPGKADLLEAIHRTGSISAAAREMGMSYRRAWILVDTMNACFTSPVVVTEKGGTAGGGARLTTTGRTLLTRYRALARAVERGFSTLVRKPRRRM